MKNRNAIVIGLLLGLAWTLALPARASFVTAVIRPTNGTTSGNGVTINGSLRYGSNQLQAATWVTNASPAQSATNLFSNLSLFHLGGGLNLSFTNTNSIVIQGTTLAVTITSGWATLNLDTNTTTNLHALMLPYSSKPAATRTNDANDQADGLQYANTNRLDATWPAFGELLNATGAAQTKTGALTIGTVSGNIGNLTNGATVGTTHTNGELRGELINYHAGDTNGSGINFGQHHLIAGASGNANLIQADGEPAEPNDPGDIITYYWLFQIMPQIGVGTNTWLSYNQWFGSNLFGGGFKGSNGLVYGFNAYGGSLSNFFAQSQISSNSATAGTNQWKGDVAYPWYDLTSLAAGNNLAVPLGTNHQVMLSGNTAAATITGFAGGRDGLPYWLYNKSSYAITLAQNTSDPTPANRIVCNVAGDIAFQPGETWRICWIPSDSRWHFEVPTASSTNGIANNNGLGTNLNVYASGPTAVGLGVTMAANPTTNAFEVRNSSGQPVFGVDTNGWASTGSTNTANRFPTTIRLFSQTADGTVTNQSVNTENSVIGTGVGTTTIPPWIWMPGVEVVYEGEGSYWTPAASPGNVGIFPRFGGNLLGGQPRIFAWSAGKTSSDRWRARYVLTCRTAGASGVIDFSGELTAVSSGSPTIIGLTNATLSINLTTNIGWDLTFSNTVGTDSLISTRGVLKAQ